MGCGGMGWGGGVVGWRAGAGWGWGICATRRDPARTHGAPQGGGGVPSLGLELLLELLDLPREIEGGEGGAARVRVRGRRARERPRQGGTGGGGQPQCTQRTRTRCSVLSVCSWELARDTCW